MASVQETTLGSSWTPSKGRNTLLDREHAGGRAPAKYVLLYLFGKKKEERRKKEIGRSEEEEKENGEDSYVASRQCEEFVSVHPTCQRSWALCRTVFEASRRLRGFPG